MKIDVPVRIEVDPAEVEGGTERIEECVICLALVRRPRLAEHMNRAHPVREFA